MSRSEEKCSFFVQHYGMSKGKDSGGPPCTVYPKRRTGATLATRVLVSNAGCGFYVLNVQIQAFGRFEFSLALSFRVPRALHWCCMSAASTLGASGWPARVPTCAKRL